MLTTAHWKHATCAVLATLTVTAGCSGGDSSDDGRWRVSADAEGTPPDASVVDGGNDTTLDTDPAPDVETDMPDADGIESCPEAPTALIGAQAESTARRIEGTRGASLEVRPLPTIHLDASPSLAREGHSIVSNGRSSTGRSAR